MVNHQSVSCSSILHFARSRRTDMLPSTAVTLSVGALLVCSALIQCSGETHPRSCFPPLRHSLSVSVFLSTPQCSWIGRRPARSCAPPPGGDEPTRISWRRCCPGTWSGSVTRSAAHWKRPQRSSRPRRRRYEAHRRPRSRRLPPCYFI